MKNLVLAIVIFVFTAGAAFGQELLAEGVDLTGGSLCGDPSFTKSVTLTGKVMKRDFDNSEMVVKGFVLRDRKDRRTYVNVDSEYISDHYSGNTIESLTEILTVGQYVRASVDVCGRIHVLRAVKVVKP